MPRAYSQDLRSRVLAAAHANRWSHRALAERFQVGESTVRLWLRLERTAGRTTPRRSPGPGPSIAGAGEQVLRDLVRAEHAATLAELAARYRERTGVAVGLMSVWRACKRLDLRRKKKKPGARRADPPGRGGGASRVA